MAKKLKFSPKKTQPGLFDLTPDLFSTLADDTADSSRDLDNDIHPSIHDFVVRKSAEAEKKQAAETAETIEIDRKAIPEPSDLLFISFGSGSSGNCSYIGSRSEGVLIDAGVDMTRVEDVLRTNGLSLDCIKGICLTHDHGDHVRYAYTLLRRHPNVGLYCTPKALNGLLRRHNISRRIKDYHRPIYKEFPFTIAGMELVAFEVSHDGTDNAGYFITSGTHTFAIATDLGCITPRVDYYMRQARYIMIESNYDADMLRQGPYPMYLKARIAAENGHLDNTVAGSFVAEIASPILSHIFLCHLSNENNTPELALSTVSRALEAAGLGPVGDASGSLQASACRLQLAALPRYEASPMYLFRDIKRP